MTGALAEDVPSLDGPGATPAVQPLTLLPQGMMGPARPAPGDPGGRTLRNDGSDPAPAQLAWERARVERRVETWITEDMAAMRAEGGSRSTWFTELKTAFEEAVRRSGMPRPDRSAFEDARRRAAEVADGVRHEAQRYATTGRMGREATQDEREVRHRTEANSFAAAARPLATGDPEHLGGGARIGEGIGRSAGLHQLLGQLGQSTLKAIVSVEQRRADGKLSSAALLKSSGNELFDELVLQAAFDAVENLPPPPPGATGSHAELVRTVWEFAGKLRYRKKLRDIAPEHRLAAVASGLLSLPLGGVSFEETTGDVYLPDLSDPELDCTARLLKLY